MLEETRYAGTVQAKYSLFKGVNFSRLLIDDPRKSLMDSVSSGDKNLVWEVRSYGVKKVTMNGSSMIISSTVRENLPDGYVFQVDSLIIRTNLVGEEAIVLVPCDGEYGLLTNKQKIEAILGSLARETERFAVYVDTQKKLLYSIKSIYMDFDELVKYWSTLVSRDSLPLIFAYTGLKEEAFFMTSACDCLNGKRSSLSGTKMDNLTTTVLGSIRK